MAPVGRQAGLKPVHLLGKIRVDPNRDDFYKDVVEQKEAHKADATLKRGLKCIGNAGAYGPLVELNEQREGADMKLNVYSGEHYHQQTTRDREVPGPFYFPPVASLITAGGRLLLALAERCIADAGGTYLFCDTDSLCIVANDTITIDGYSPKLSSELFREGNVLLLFLKRDSHRTDEAPSPFKSGYEDVDENCGAVKADSDAAQGVVAGLRGVK